MTGDDTQGGAGQIGAVMQLTTRRGPVDIPHLFCPVEEGSNPGGDRESPNVPKTPFMRERERESGTQWERDGEERKREWDAMGEDRREGERERGREWERDPQNKSRGLTGAKGGWWVRADQGVWEAMAVKSSLMLKQRGAIAPLEHGRDTSYRVGRPEHDRGSENAVRVMGARRHGHVGG